jgi:menaquinol-cytochrome c reductase iron-sulfur subunit
MDHHHAHHPDRRNFITKAAAVVIGGIITVVPALAGLFVLFDPLRRGRGAGRSVRVASINSLPENGAPRKFDVVATQVDAWNKTPNVAVGSVYLQRTGPNEVRALNTICPHAGCSVGFKAGENRFHCPCHDSSFAVDGKILNPKSPSPRAMDELEVEIREGGEIWVKYQNFRKGVHEKIPV